MNCVPTKQQRRPLERVATTVKCRRLNCDLENKKAQIVTEIQVALITMFSCLLYLVGGDATKGRSWPWFITWGRWGRGVPLIPLSMTF